MEEDLVQESQYSVRHDAQQTHKSNHMEKGKNKVKIVNNDFEKTPQTIVSETRNKSRPSTIFG